MKLICGMHRSGTSLVARLAHAAGGDFGDEHTFHPGDRWNPDGYFEQREILDLNIALVNGPWGRVAYLHLPSDATIARRAQCHVTSIHRLAEAYDSRIVKENRFCLTLGAWREHGARVERLLIVFRHPTAVARSLGRRNYLLRSLSWSLWMQHHERLFAHAEGIAFRVLCYEHLVGQVEQRKAREAAKIAWVAGCQPETIAPLVERFSRPAPATETLALSPPIQEMYDRLMALSEGGE